MKNYYRRGHRPSPYAKASSFAKASEDRSGDRQITDHRLRVTILAALALAWCFGTFMSSPPVFALDEPVIIDHTSVAEFENIPDAYIEAAKNLSLHFGTTLVDSEIVIGLIFLEIEPTSLKVYNPNYDNPKYNIRLNIRGIEEEPEPNPALYIRVDTAYHEDYWSTSAGKAATNAFADSGLYGYSMWAWDDEDYTNYDAAFIQSYLDALDEFEESHPDMNFIYMTRYVIDDTGITDRNDTIRTYCRNNNKVLFDIEDIIAYAPPYNPDNPVKSDDEDFTMIVKAKAFWVMMAKLAGWDSSTPSRMLGDVTGDGMINILDVLQTARYAVGLIELQGDALWAADVNGDASVNILDIILITRRAVGLINNF